MPFLTSGFLRLLRKTGLDRKTEKSYLPRHLIAVAATRMWPWRERVVDQRATIHAGGSARGRPRRRFSCGPRSESPPTRKWAARFEYKVNCLLRIASWERGADGGPGAEASNRSRKSQCPSPPWDTAFPGAFFMRWRLPEKFVRPTLSAWCSSLNGMWLAKVSLERLTCI